MKQLLASFFDFLPRLGRKGPAHHDDRLRANQPNEPYYTFSYWRSLVG